MAAVTATTFHHFTGPALHNAPLYAVTTPPPLAFVAGFWEISRVFSRWRCIEHHSDIMKSPSTFVISNERSEPVQASIRSTSRQIDLTGSPRHRSNAPPVERGRTGDAAAKRQRRVTRRSTNASDTRSIAGTVRTLALRCRVSASRSTELVGPPNTASSNNPVVSVGSNRA